MQANLGEPLRTKQLCAGFVWQLTRFDCLLRTFHVGGWDNRNSLLQNKGLGKQDKETRHSPHTKFTHRARSLILRFKPTIVFIIWMIKASFHTNKQLHVGSSHSQRFTLI